MKFSEGNAKLGTGCLAVSRPVGETCPNSCEFLGNGCYAEKTEKLYPNVRKASSTNLITEQNRIRSMLILAKSQGKSVRWHVSGDFFLNGKLDLQYIKNIKGAIESLKENDRPKMWFYTHIYSKKISALDKLGIVCYASVNSKKQLAAAKRAGFRLFAWSDKVQEISKRTQNGKPHTHLSAKQEIEGEKFIVCPEQRLGRDKFTCTGHTSINKKTGEVVKSHACQICVNGTANILFLVH